jgi:hypothetical protein
VTPGWFERDTHLFEESIATSAVAEQAVILHRRIRCGGRAPGVT